MNVQLGRNLLIYMLIVLASAACAGQPPTHPGTPTESGTPTTQSGGESGTPTSSMAVGMPAKDILVYFGTPTSMDGQDFPSIWVYESLRGEIAYEMRGRAIVGLAIQRRPVNAAETEISGAQTTEYQLTIQFDATQRVRGFSYDTMRSQGL